MAKAKGRKGAGFFHGGGAGRSHPDLSSGKEDNSQGIPRYSLGGHVADALFGSGDSEPYEPPPLRRRSPAWAAQHYAEGSALADVLGLSGTASRLGNRAAGIFAQGVEIAVKGQDQGAGVGNPQNLRRHRDALIRQTADFVAQGPGIEHDAVADHRQGAANDPRGKKRQFVGLVADDEGVAGIVTPLEARDDIGAAGKPVDYLALALIAPLAADHGDVRQNADPENAPASPGGPPLGKARPPVHPRCSRSMNETLF
jgi:hypothetical protein